jgi:hypothetical protein
LAAGSFGRGVEMAFRFRRTMKIAPGVRVNFTHRGVSARIGPRGLGYTVNVNGRQHVSAGIPGSGIHVSEQIKPTRHQRRPGDAAASQTLKKPTSTVEIVPTIASLVVLLIVAVVIIGAFT